MQKEAVQLSALSSKVHLSHVVKQHVMWEASSRFQTIRHKLVNVRTKLTRRLWQTK
jgi:hypothetical protein